MVLLKKIKIKIKNLVHEKRQAAGPDAINNEADTVASTQLIPMPLFFPFFYLLSPLLSSPQPIVNSCFFLCVFWFFHIFSTSFLIA